MSQSYAQYQDPPSQQPASRKLKRKHQSGASQQQQRTHPGQPRSGGGAPGAGAGAGGRQALAPPTSTGSMAWGHAYEDESTDLIMDEMDRLTPRDLAVARFRRNYDLMDAIFDERKIVNLQPGPSPYEQLSKANLQAELEKSEAQTVEMTKRHQERLESFKQNISPEQIEKELARHAEGDAADESVAPWARNAGKGRRLTAGFAYVPVRTPDVVIEAMKAREAALAGQRYETLDTPQLREHKAVEDEAIRQLNLEHGMEPPPPAPPQLTPQGQHLAQRPPSHQQSQPQPPQQPAQPPTQPLPSAPQQQQQDQPQQEQQKTALIDTPSEQHLSSMVVDPLPSSQQDDSEMVEIVGDGQESAAGLAASEQTKQAEEEAEVQHPKAEEAVTEEELMEEAGGEAEALTHPLSAAAEAAAARGALESTSQVVPADPTAVATHAEEAAEKIVAQEETTRESAKEASQAAAVQEQQTLPEKAAHQTTGIDVSTAPQPTSSLSSQSAHSEAAPVELAGSETVLAESKLEREIEASSVSGSVSAEIASAAEKLPVAVDEIMKAPTPPLDESLADNGGAKRL